MNVMDTELQAQPEAPARPRRRRRAAPLVAVLLLAAAVPAAVLAASFADVPAGTTFYNAIEKVFAARITGGCGGGNYCPKANVTREQMAAFLGRTGSIGEQATGGAVLSLEGAAVLGEVTIRAGEITGGTAYIQLIGTFGAFTDDIDANAFPYKGVFAIADADGPLIGFEHYIQIESLADDGFGDASGAVQVLIEAPTAVTKTYQLLGQQLAGTEGGLTAYGTIQAMYAPFSNGGGWTNPEPVKGGDRQLGGTRGR
jgi:hypothetical protein